jgi:hypothetical protein
MPEVDVMDATWIGCRPAAVARIVADAANWRRWWPDLDLELDERRGVKGVRWSVRSGRKGTVAGSMEIWLQAVDQGTVAHYFLRLDGARRPLTQRERRRLEHDFRVRIKQILWAVADRVDPGRLARLAGPPARIP